MEAIHGPVGPLTKANVECMVMQSRARQALLKKLQVR